MAMSGNCAANLCFKESSNDNTLVGGGQIVDLPTIRLACECASNAQLLRLDATTVHRLVAVGSLLFIQL